MTDTEIVQKIKELLSRFPIPKDLDWLFMKLESERKNFEKNKEYQKKYYLNNKKELESKHKEYRKTHTGYREKVRKTGREYKDE